MVQTNNELYKAICEAYGITVEEGVQTNNYYLKKIATKICGSYTGTHCNGKYLKDIAEELSETTYTGHHFNNFWLKKICEAQTGETYDNNYDNYFLQEWADSITTQKTLTSLTINLDKTFLEIGEWVTVSGRLTDDLGNGIANAPLLSHSSHESAQMTTDSNGYYSIRWHYGTSAYNHIAHHYVTYAGNWEYQGCQSETVDVSFRRTSTLSIETPLITYTDEFDVQGSLIDGLGEPIANATVTLTWNDGSDHTATTTTTSTGGILLHRDAVTSVGSYSFQLSFDGGSRYVASNSSVVNVTPDKETTVLNITSPASGSTVSSDSVTITGTLEDNDGTPMTGKTVYFVLNSVQPWESVTVQSDGSFSKTLTGLATGSNLIDCGIPSTDTHTSASQSITVNRVPFDDFSFTADKGILSFADSEQSELKVQLLSNGSIASFSGVEVKLYKDSVLWDTLYTDSTGKVTKTYASQGIGDIEFEAKVEINGTLVSETFSIQDITYADMGDTDKSSNYDITALGGTITYDNDHYILKPSLGAKALVIDGLLVSKNVQIDCDVKINALYNEQIVLAVYKSSNNTGIGAGTMISPQYNESQVQIRSGCSFTSLGSEIGKSNHSHPSWHHLTLICQDGSITAKYNNTEKTITSSYTLENSNKVGFTTYMGNANASFEFKNLKVREL